MKFCGIVITYVKQHWLIDASLSFCYERVRLVLFFRRIRGTRLKVNPFPRVVVDVKRTSI